MSSMRKWRGLFLVAIMAVAACRSGEHSAGNEASDPVPANETNLPDELPLPEAALDRAGFLKAMASAASAHTAGARSAADLDGRRFAIRIRFGCDGPAPAGNNGPLRWTEAKDKASIEIMAKPDLSLEAEALAGISDQTIEAVEGFWIPRPWQMDDSCPATEAGDAEAILPAPQLVGLAQYFTAEDSRVGRRSGRPYVATRKIASPAELPKSGLILLLEGRFEAWPDGQVIRCAGSGRNQRPACIASAHLDRAAFLKPDDSSVIAEWRE
jgi:hypothetical protein